ncbi:helicase-related protein [Flavobacterium oreochromis]|uniref:helicase-related protein n=1 Tax=Flavobacterium oreochromis TaxID=2906078 RepID=UPI0038591411
MSKLTSLIKKEFEQNQDLNTILTFKGIKLSDLPDELKIKCIDYEFWEDDKINTKKLFSREAKLKLITELSSNDLNTRLISYEALIYGHKLAKDIGIISDIKVIDFSIYEFHQNNLNVSIQNIEDVNEQGEELADEDYHEIFASSIEIDKIPFVQFRDGDLLKKSKLINYFSLKEFNLNDFKTINEHEIANEDFVYNFENRDYIKKVNDIILDYDSPINILVDNVLKTDLKASEQLSIILDCFDKLKIEYSLKRIVFDLTKATRPELNFLLKKHWNSNAFRTLKVYADPDLKKDIIEISQAEVVEAIIEEYENGNIKNKNIQDVFLTAPTGAGKSLLFQLPAIFLGENYKAVSIVVTPLKALMVDQVNQLKEKANYNKVAFINSDITVIERDEILEDIKKGEIDILYLAPELLLSYDISYFLATRKLGLYIVDEAHTVTTWGRDFRVDYWYLGYHISKVRKYAKDEDGKKLKFVVVAVTATAPYGNTHDVVFETLKSLQMHYAKKYIGYAKRDDISFQINHVNIDGNLQTQKVNQTVERIREFENEKKKTIVYCPFRNQVDEVILRSRENDISVFPFHSGLNQEIRERSYEQFKNSSSITMIATKAFGMGIDVNDITQVYHLAPTGLLTDYIQEIGRLARREDLQGIASVDFSNRDFQFINVLHGLNRTFDWQLREVMNRLYRLYDETEKQNHLVNADEFAHIFSGNAGENLQNSLKNALMLIEKDLNIKYNRIPVIIARPKNLFATVFASIHNDKIELINSKLNKDCFSIREYEGLKQYNRSIIILELDRIWEQNFRDKSFAILKRDFFTNKLFNDIELEPKIRINLSLNGSLAQTQTVIQDYFNRISIALSNQSGFFEKEQFMLALVRNGMERQVAERISEFILPMFSQRDNINLSVADVIENSNFLQSKKFDDKIKYRIVDGAVTQIISNIRRTINAQFQSRRTIEKYLSRDSAQKKLYSKIGQILEVFEIGTYSVTGGENPKIFVRINDPFRLRQVTNNHYQNTLLADVRNRHLAGVALMQDFFSITMTSAERWDFIEDYFLGIRV